MVAVMSWAIRPEFRSTSSGCEAQRQPAGDAQRVEAGDVPPEVGLSVGDPPVGVGEVDPRDEAPVAGTRTRTVGGADFVLDGR